LDLARLFCALLILLAIIEDIFERIIDGILLQALNTFKLKIRRYN